MNQQPERKARRPIDGLARFTFYITLLIFVWPIHADMLVGLLSTKKLFYAVLFTLSCVTIILIPTIISFRRLFADPTLRGRGYIYSVFVILLISLAWMVAGVAHSL
jgi:hypothetical protein